SDYFLENGDEKVQLQRIESVYANENPRLVGVTDLPPCGFKTFGLKKRSASAKTSLPQSGEISNEYYSAKWDNARKGFAITDREEKRTVLFRPFSGEIVH